MSEHTEQCALMQWANLQDIAELDLLFAIPNGGDRDVRVGRKLKAEGVKRGVPDLLLPVARGGYHGLFIEMKWGRNRPTIEQRAWLEALTFEGYRCEVCYGWEEARDLLCEYLGIKERTRS